MRWRSRTFPLSLRHPHRFRVNENNVTPSTTSENTVTNAASSRVTSTTNRRSITINVDFERRHGRIGKTITTLLVQRCVRDVSTNVSHHEKKRHREAVENRANSVVESRANSVEMTSVDDAKDSDKAATDRENCYCCMETRANIVFLPCRHLVCCEKCAEQLTKYPMCRTTIWCALVVIVI